jgi:hypothetical protein
MITKGQNARAASVADLIRVRLGPAVAPGHELAGESVWTVVAAAAEAGFAPA